MHQINIVAIFYNIKIPVLVNAIKMYGEMSLQNHMDMGWCSEE
jgi:hypothetical protein